MPAYLLFQLYGPMQSYGGVCPGEIRDSGDHPAKSAVLGLIAGALGIERDQEDLLAELATGYWFAVRQDVPGTPLLDYHTAQTRPGKRGRFASRRHELQSGLKPGESPLTILSTRHYLQDALFTACLRPVDESPPHTLEALRQALEHPVFAPYLGRKSCPLALPMNPMVAQAASLVEAFAVYPPERSDHSDRPDRKVWRQLGGQWRTSVRLFWEGPDGPEPGHEVVRRDALLHRGRWQYRERIESECAVPTARREEA